MNLQQILQHKASNAFVDTALENCVQRTVKLLETSDHPPEVILRAMVQSAFKRHVETEPQSPVDQFLAPGANPVPTATPGVSAPPGVPHHPALNPTPPQHPGLAPQTPWPVPGRQRPPDVPDPAIFGPQNF